MRQSSLGNIASVIFSLIGLTSCATTNHGTRNIEKIFAQNIHYRRPTGAGASFAALPGGEDYRSTPLPNERLDCQNAGEFFAALNFGEIQKCLTSLVDGTRVSYRLIRDTTPYLKLETPELTASCVTEWMSEIPVPREIVFQSDEEGKYQCYSSRINLDADRFLGARAPISTWSVELVLPPSTPLRNEDETRRLIQAWVLSPYRDSSSHSFKSRILIDRACRQCMTEEGMLQEGKSVPAYWP